MKELWQHLSKYDIAVKVDSKDRPADYFTGSQLIPIYPTAFFSRHKRDGYFIHSRTIFPGCTKAAGPASHLPSHRIFLPIFGNTYNV